MVAASAVIAANVGGLGPLTPPATVSRNHCRQRPALSWLLPSRYGAPPSRPSPGTAAELPDDVGLLRRQRAADPRGRPDRQVGLVGTHEPRADRRAVQVGESGDHLRTGGDAQLGGDRRLHRPDDRARRDQRRQLRSRHPGEPHQLGVVAEDVESAVVGEPGGGHRHVRGRGEAGEAHREVVDRLEVPPGPARDLRLLPLREQQVAEGVVAVRRRDTAGAAYPRRQGDRVVPEHVPPHDGARQVATTRVHPHQAVPDRGPRLVHRHGAGPLPGHPDHDDLVAVEAGLGQAPAGALDHELPPFPGVLGRGSSGSPSRGDGSVVPPHDLATCGDQPDLRAAGPQVDGQREPAGRIAHQTGGGTDCWVSSMSVMTARMNSSTSLVSPSATPP